EKVTFWAFAYGIRSRDVVEIGWHAPDGSLYRSFTFPQDNIRGFWAMDTLQAENVVRGLPRGAWSVDLTINGIVEAHNEFTVSVDPTELAGTFAFNASNYYVTENGKQATITVTRTGWLGPASVDYRT